MGEPDLYDVLGVDRKASAAEIARAYKRGAARAHPDREGGDERRMVALNQAMAVLGDPARRARYDRTGDAGVQHGVEAQGAAMAVLKFAEALDRVRPGSDPVKEARAAVEDERKLAARRRRQFEQGVAQTEKLAPRLRGSALLAGLFEQRREMLATAIATAKEAEEIATAALKALEGAEWEVEDPPEMTARKKCGAYIAGRSIPWPP